MKTTEDDEPLSRHVLKLSLVLLLHAAVLAWLLQQQFRASPQPQTLAMDVRMIDLSPPPPLPPPEKKPPPVPKPQAVAPQPVTAPPPVLTAAPSSTPTAAGFVVPPQPPAPPREAAAMAAAPTVQAAPLPVTAARFDADYLNNPAPVYPALSRRRGEQGQVLLLVRVTSQGLPEGVELRQSSGHARLDEAAVTAVRQWRFVPARRGSEAVASSVIVPIIFRQDG